MRILPFLLLPLLLPVHSPAQMADSSSHAIGFFGETNTVLFVGSGSDDPIISTAGLQYNKWNKKHFGYKIILGYANFSFNPPINVDLVKADTARGGKC